MPSPMFEFAYFADYEKALDYLTHLAQPENWEYRHSPTVKKHPVLNNYLNYTFARVKEEGKVNYSSDQKLACFNTGLVTEYFEEIIALFAQNQVQGRQPYFFKAFLPESDRQLTFAKIPEIAKYYEDSRKLVFDIKLDHYAFIQNIKEKESVQH